MTKEQETIEYIEKRIKICNENADICDDNDFDEEATCLREESYMLETVLNMLKEKDRQINSKNGAINALQCALKERTEERDKKGDIVAKQNKIIDLMAEDWFFKEGYKLQIYKQRNRTDDRIFRKKRKYNQNV